MSKHSSPHFSREKKHTKVKAISAGLVMWRALGLIRPLLPRLDFLVLWQVD
jgi:hypothetical protein